MMEHTNDKVIRVASEALDAIYGHLSDGVIVVGEDGVILYGNPAAEKTVGAGSPLAGRTLNDAIPADSVCPVDGSGRASLPGAEIAFRAAGAPSGDVA